jgi:hypothetical protein
MDFILVMVICSVIESNKCHQVPLPLDNFKDHYDCVSFAYDFSHSMITNMSREFVNKQGAYIKFFCEESPKVST